MEISVILVGLSLNKFNGHSYTPLTILFSSQNSFQVLPFEHVIFSVEKL